MDYRTRWQQQRRLRQRKRLLAIPVALALAGLMALLARNVGGDGGVRWTYQIFDTMLPHMAAGQSLMYLAWPNGHIEALRLSDGVRIGRGPLYSVPEGFNASPTVAGEVLYIGSDLGIFRALDARSGKLLWKVDMEAPIRCQPLFHGGRVYVGNQAGRVYCFMPGGTRVWMRELGEAVAGEPAVVDKLLVVATVRGIMYGLNVETGQPVWSRELQFRDGETSPDALFSPVAAAPPLVAIGADSGYLHVLKAATGARVGQYYSNGLVRSAAVVTDEVIAFGSTDGWLRVISRDGKKPLWAHRLPGPVTAGPAAADGLLVVGSPTRVLALDASSGRVLRSWKGRHFAGDIIIVNKTAHVATTEGGVMALATP